MASHVKPPSETSINVKRKMQLHYTHQSISINIILSTKIIQ